MGATANVFPFKFNILTLYYNGLKREHVHKICTRFHDLYRGYAQLLHTICTRKEECTRMAAIVKLPSGSWRAQVRRKGKYVTATFLRRKDADEWSLATERNIDRGVLPNSPDPKSVRTLASIIDLISATTRKSASQSGDPSQMYLKLSAFHSVTHVFTI